MTTMKSAEEFKQEALQAIKDLGGFPYNPDIYWSYRAVKDIPVWKEQYFHPAIGDGKSMQWMEDRAYEKIKNDFGEEVAEKAKRYCEKLRNDHMTPHGHVVYNAGILNGFVIPQCSNCRKLIDEEDLAKGVCPHCGTIFDDGYEEASVDPFGGNKMSDPISREQAIDAIGELSDTIFKNIEKGATYPPRAWFAGMASAESIIEGLPSIDAVKHGRWKYISFLTVECSECKAQIHDLEYSNFCPNCGAKMDETVDE